jgi:hypothetical protein
VPPIIYYETYDLSAGIYYANGYEYVPEHIVTVYTYTYTTTRTSTPSLTSKPFNPDIYWDEYNQPQANTTATTTFNPDRYWDEYDMPVKKASVNWLGTSLGILTIGAIGLIAAAGAVKRKLSPVTAEVDDEEPSQGYYAEGWRPGGAGGGMTAAEDGQWGSIGDAETRAAADASGNLLSADVETGADEFGNTAKDAERLGFQKTNARSHGQAVYKKGNLYITPDVDSHNGGVWKMASSIRNLGSKSTRIGTYDGNLRKIGN